jgi:hypothetical protein
MSGSTPSTGTPPYWNMAVLGCMPLEGDIAQRKQSSSKNKHFFAG